MLAYQTSPQIADRKTESSGRSRLPNVKNYKLLRKLGQGGMGEVYLAEHQHSKHQCAVKVLRTGKADDSVAKSRFQAEAQTMSRLTHPNTVRILDHGVAADGTCFYAMEYLAGLNLEEIVTHFGPLSPERVVHLLRQVCWALKEAHQLGLVHRDIKPANIFATKRDERYDVAKLLDFGLVKSSSPDVESASVTVDGAFVGSPHFAPPETTLGDLPFDARGDIYSLGATAYFLLAGRPVFKDENPLKVIFAHANQAPTPLSECDHDIPQSLAEIIMKCLEKKPDDRFQTVELLDEALSRLQLDNRWTQQHAAAWWQEFGSLPLNPVAETEDTATCLVSGATN